MSIDVYIKGGLVYSIYSVYKCYIDLYRAIIELYRKVIFSDAEDTRRTRYMILQQTCHCNNKSNEC